MLKFSCRSARKKKPEKGQNPCTSGNVMYRIEDKKKQLKLEDFMLPFGGKLNGKKIAGYNYRNSFHGKKFEEQYAQQFSDGVEGGAPAKPFRVALGALIIKEKLNLTDRETVEQIRENPYLQYLIGKEAYSDDEPFDASMMVHFRKRITGDMLGEINERLHVEEVKKNEKLKKKRLKRKKKLR